jgi:hypothetical protein
MCGDLKPWQWRHDVVVRMTSPATLPGTTPVGGALFTQANDASVNIPLMQPLDMIEEVWLTEYQLSYAEDGSTSTMWRLSFLRSNLQDAVSCNSSGTGIPICAAGGTDNIFHVKYDNPRRLSVTHKSGGITTLSVDVTDEFGQPVVFADMTFMLSFIMKKRDWDPAQVMRNDANQVEWWRPNTNVGRMIV